MRYILLLAATLALLVRESVADEAPDFSRDILPILSQNCFVCHGGDAKSDQTELRLDSFDAATKRDADGNAAIVPKKPDRSALIERINSTDVDVIMPPPKSNNVLKPEQKKLLEAWIKSGAEYKPHWAYVAPVRSALPKVKMKDWVLNPIDHFILNKLEQSRLKPSPEADRFTLVRRLYIDLIGLLPTPEEVQEFVSDSRPDAYERLVEKLLASEHYGERMALPWLDAARFADTNGFQADRETSQWVWRDWIIKMLNRDMPFDQFSIEQLAGDLLPDPTPEQMIATAFNRNHLSNGEGGAIPEEQRFNVMFDRVDTTATTFLGLTVACAQCHNHKYDPIKQRDYYGMMHLFNQVSESGLAEDYGPPRGRNTHAASPFFIYGEPEDRKQSDKLWAEVNRLEEIVKPLKEKVFVQWRDVDIFKTPEKYPEHIIKHLKVPKGELGEGDQKELESDLRSVFESKVWKNQAEKKIPDAVRLRNVTNRARNFDAKAISRVMVMRDDQPRETFVLDRGDYLKPKKDEKVEFSVPAFLPPIPADAPKNRLGFARWLFLPEHPLTARVQVNRMWQTLFGVGLAKTTEDFGVQGDHPVYQELLDWLAVEFREKGWSMKQMHRLIVTSAMYRQSSKVTKELLERDPENRLLARAPRFRMPSMIIRDAALGASGLIDARILGEPVYPYQPDGIWASLAITKERSFAYPKSKGNDLYRRSVYTFWRRTVSPANMFDSSSRQTCKVRASVTSTPLHALTTLNDTTWAEASRVLAEHAMQSDADVKKQISYAFFRVLSREPSEAELRILSTAFEKQRSRYASDDEAAQKVVHVGEAIHDARLNAADHAAMTGVCLAIMNMDEALTRE